MVVFSCNNKGSRGRWNKSNQIKEEFKNFRRRPDLSINTILKGCHIKKNYSVMTVLIQDEAEHLWWESHWPKRAHQRTQPPKIGTSFSLTLRADNWGYMYLKSPFHTSHHNVTATRRGQLEWLPACRKLHEVMPTTRMFQISFGQIHGSRKHSIWNELARHLCTTVYYNLTPLSLRGTHSFYRTRTGDISSSFKFATLHSCLMQPLQPLNKPSNFLNVPT